MAKEPESWGELVANYRDDYGSRSYQTIKKDGSNTVRRLSTSGPFLTDLTGINNYSRTGKGKERGNQEIGKAINDRHGWGTLDLLQPNEGGSGKQGAQPQQKGTGRRLIPGAGPGVAANRPAPAHLTDRKNLFGVLQGSEAGATDGWIGNELIDPTKGKTCASSGRADGKSWIKMEKGTRVEDDGWIGNIQIQPAKGKKPTPGPEQRTARKDLFEVMNGTGNSSIQDSWIGNIAIDPSKGKGYSGRAAGKQEDLHSVMQHKYLKGDERGSASGPAPAPAARKENIGGFNFSESKQEKFGKRILEKPSSNDARADKKTGTKKLPVPRSRSGSDIGPTSGKDRSAVLAEAYKAAYDYRERLHDLRLRQSRWRISWHPPPWPSLTFL